MFKKKYTLTVYYTKDKALQIANCTFFLHMNHYSTNYIISIIFIHLF